MNKCIRGTISRISTNLTQWAMEEACILVLEDIPDVHSYHWECYQLFTKNLNRLSEILSDATEPSTSRPPRSSIDEVIFKPVCIFFKGKPKINQSEKLLDNRKYTNVVNVAKRVGDEDLYLRILEVDLFAAEARYHKSCREKYVAN